MSDQAREGPPNPGETHPSTHGNTLSFGHIADEREPVLDRTEDARPNVGETLAMSLLTPSDEVLLEIVAQICVVSLVYISARSTHTAHKRR